MKQEKFFVKNQFYFIFITRMIPFIPKTITSVISGIYNLNFYKYVAYTFIASYPTLFIYVYIGNNLGENYSEIKNYVGGFGFPILIILIIVIIGYFLFKYFKIKQNQ